MVSERKEGSYLAGCNLKSINRVNERKGKKKEANDDSGRSERSYLDG